MQLINSYDKLRLNRKVWLKLLISSSIIYLIYESDVRNKDIFGWDT